jgi:two-component system sensor kinase FixL
MQSELLHISRLSTMGEMASALAHELNQPLSAIVNYLQGSRRLLQNSTDDRAPMIREAMNKAAEQAVRAGQVIQRLRDFVARGETEKRIESITRLVEEATALALVAASGKRAGVDGSTKPWRMRRNHSDCEPKGLPLGALSEFSGRGIVGNFHPIDVASLGNSHAHPKRSI